jgi:signal transduction histidine kinase
MFEKLLTYFREQTMTAILTTAVVGALLLQLNLLSSELEVQRQQFDTQVGVTASKINERVRLFVRRKSLGSLSSTTGDNDSTMTIQTPLGKTTLKWSNAQVHNPYGMGMDTTVFGGFLDNFQDALPWESQLSRVELDSLLTEELKANQIRTKPQWAVAENGYLSSLRSEDFDVNSVTFNFVLAESFFGPTRQLLMYFPSEKMYLARRVYLSVFASLLFSAVILIAFFGVQRQGRRQKRLADVKSDFINNMSHEFKTPLATINLAVDTLMKNAEKMNADQVTEYLKVIKTENKRMNAQMESVLQMSMMDKEELTLEFGRVELDALLQECVDHFKLTVSERNGWIDLTVQSGNYGIDADATQLKSALTNLIDNAIKYSLEVPEVSVRLRELEHEFTVEVKDRGVGMDEETMRQVFDRFFRATKGNIHDVKGHGLGLSFVKEIIEKHGGHIEVQSTLGEGSTFSITLPKPE